MAALACLAAAVHAAADEPARKSMTAYRTEKPPVIDGVLDDPVWQQAACVEDMHIVVSNEGAPPGDRSR